MSIGIPRIYFANCRVSGAAGQIVWQIGGIAKNGLTRVGPGVYDFLLDPGLSPLEGYANVLFIANVPGSELTWEQSFPSYPHLLIRTFADGVPFDLDFFLEVIRIREADPTETEPAPSPPPPPPDPPGSSAPRHATLWHDEDATISGTPIGIVVDSNQAYNEFAAQLPSANGDIFEQEFFLEAGTYDFHVLGITFSNRGILDWAVDGTPIGVQDWYTAGLAYNVIKTIPGVVIPASGQHTLRGTINGTNGASIAPFFNMVITKSWFS
jgi:hypothetical protein